MADSKITALTAISTVDPTADPLVIVDVSDTSMAASGTTKKSTINQLLGAGGTATLASATITGDLTVDTSTLKVDSANNRVGVNTASPAQSVDIASGNLQVRTGGTVFSDTFSNYGAALAINAAGSLPLRLQIGATTAYEIGATNIHTWQNVGGFAGTAMTLNSTGLGVGVVPSAGKGALQLSSGINFPATQVASSDANTLDDYVETTFSPTIAGSTTAGTATYTTQIGRATKIGRLVTFSIRVAYSAGTGTGNLRVGNLPFAAGSGSIFAVYAENIALTAGNYPVCGISSGNTFISIDQLPTGGGAAVAVPYDAAGDIQISGSYIV